VHHEKFFTPTSIIKEAKLCYDQEDQNHPLEKHHQNASVMPQTQ